MGIGNQAIKIILTALLLTGGAAARAGECRDDEVTLRGAWGQARFSVELAQTREERNRGLMNRPDMPRGAGMLFIYDAPGSVAFWMKNTLIALDIIFMDETGTVQRVHPMAKPHDTTPLFGGHNIQYVLEINGGLAEDMGIGEGTELRHPSIDQGAAAWAC